MRTISICNRCGHIWLKRKKTVRTKQCPKCRSPYWDKERVESRSEFMKRKWKEPEFRKNHMEYLIKRWSDPKEIEKQSEVAVKRWKDPYKRQKQIDVVNKRWENPEERVKQSGVANKRWGDLEQRKRQSATVSKRWENVEERKKQSDIMKGENHPNWQGGISFEPYCLKFNKEFKERVRIFFGRVCVECKKTEEENGRKLNVHHVNYDKMICCNDVKPLFVALCCTHNAMANTDREYWENHYTEIINEKYGGKCYFTLEEMKEYDAN